ncbi:MAG: pyrroline-5-carboxylate reductase [Rickettsiales bacterium]|nr:pyrroline-5-carboxylate reductase [Rickettsiales bacterium]
MRLENKKILLVGCGKMGSALLNGWVKNGISQKNIYVIDPYLPKNFNENVFSNVEELRKNKSLLSSNFFLDFDICIFAIKPQSFEEVLPTYHLVEKTLIISIAAGVSINKISNLAKFETSNRKIVRVMPNLPASVGAGVNAYFANKNVTEDDRYLIEDLFFPTGLTFQVNSEDEIDKVTALSGSGPAYFYYFIEAMQEKAKNLGFEENIANEIAKQTAIGAIKLLESSRHSAKQLREDVTSPKGTTEAGLSVLMNGQLQKILDETIDKAFIRAKELSNLS